MTWTGRRTPLNLPGASSLKSWHGWWSGYTYDPTLYNPGTSPAVTFSGIVPGQCGFGIKYTLGGSLGTAKFQYTLDNGATYNGSDITSAASVGPLGTTGLSLSMGAGTYVINETASMVVGAWSGLSPSAHQFLQATASKKPRPFPTAKGTPLLFDGVNDLMVCTSGLAGSLGNGDDTPFTLMSVHQHVTFSASGDDCAVCIGSNTTNALFDIFRHASTGKWASNKHADTGSFVTVDSATAPDTSLHIHEVVHYGTTLDYLIDGTSILTGAAQDVASCTFNALSLGATLFHGAENNWGNVLQYELRTWAGAQDVNVRAYNRQQLRNVYGI